MPRKQLKRKRATMSKGGPYKRKLRIERPFSQAKTSNQIATSAKRASTARGPLNVKQRATFVYAENVALNPAGAPANYVFSCNGLYDPNITGTGHQPRGFDQLMALYDHYVVIGARITVMYSNQDGSNAQFVTVRVLDTATPTATTKNVMENRYVKAACADVATGGNPSGSLDLSINPNKFLGRSKPLSDPDVKGSAAANPVEQCYFHISTFATDSLTDPGAMDVFVRIEYDTLLLEPKQPSES